MEKTMSEVLGAEEQEVADPAETQETGAEERELAELADTKEIDTTEKGSGKTEQDEAFAEMRRAKEAAEAEKAEAEKRAIEMEEELTRQNALLSRVSDAEDPTLDIAAQMLGIDPAELEEALNEEIEQERIEQERDTLQEELDHLRIEKAMEKDLLEVKKIDPKVESLEDLGSAFFNCIGAGMSATEAYYASKYVAEKTTTVPPSEIGKISQSEVEKDFFTKAEVEAMSPEEVEKNLEKIEKSQKKW